MSDFLAALAETWDHEPECRCVETDRETDTLDCPLHAETPEGRQWNRDHPDGISDEELESMARYAYESCRDEGHA
jgi:hypothetical protein